LNDVALKKFAAFLATGISLILIAVKAVAWHLSDSVSLLSSLIDSLVDSFASFLNLIAIYHAAKPADLDHRFGHGKIEALSALGQSLFILGSSVFIFKEAVERFIHPQPLENSGFVIGATIISIILTAILVFIQKRVIQKTNSLAIQADHAHYKTDLFINGGILAVIIGDQYLHIGFLDPFFGAIVGCYIAYASYKILKQSLAILMDRELSETERQKIGHIIRSHPKVHGYHLLRTRSSGTGEFIQCHLELSGSMSLTEAHIISHEVEQKIREAFPNADIILHQDPAHIIEDHRDGL
jgi:ferrous-iron efflux pump FieF